MLPIYQLKQQHPFVTSQFCGAEIWVGSTVFFCCCCCCFSLESQKTGVRYWLDLFLTGGSGKKLVSKLIWVVSRIQLHTHHHFLAGCQPWLLVGRKIACLLMLPLPSSVQARTGQILWISLASHSAHHLEKTFCF